LVCEKYRILLIDDEIGWCKVLTSGLQENDLEVEYETKAGNALKRIDSFASHAVLLDVLFSNINRGKKTFKNIKVKYPQTTVVMLTNTVTEEDFSLEDYSGCAFAYAKDQLNFGTDDVYRTFAEKIRHAIQNADATAFQTLSRCVYYIEKRFILQLHISSFFFTIFCNLTNHFFRQATFSFLSSMAMPSSSNLFLILSASSQFLDARNSSLVSIKAFIRFSPSLISSSSPSY